MGRLPKKGVDYFSHDIGAAGRPTLYTIQESFGNDGYALWFKLLEYLGSTESLVLDSNNSPEWLFFVAYAKVSEEKARDIINTLALTGAIDNELWFKHGIIWSDGFVTRVQDVFRKRGTETPKKPVFCDRNQDDADIPEQKTEEPEKDPEEKPKRSRKKTASGEQQSDDGKIKYAEYVRMTEEQYTKLCDEIGKAAADKAIVLLDLYKGSKGKTYKDDYRAILSWVIEKIKKEYPALIRTPQNATTASQGGNPFDNF